MLNRKSALLGVFILSFIIISVSFTSAITGSIGNARMILNAQQGDVIEKTILVINVNDVAVDVGLSTSGDLADSIEILDKNFTLQPKEEKKARIEITVAKSGTTETSVNVQFTPVDGKNGVGLSSKIIVNAEGTAGFWSFLKKDSGNTNSTDFSDSTGNSKSSNLFIIVALVVVFVVLLVALFFVVSGFRKNKFKKGIGRSF